MCSGLFYSCGPGSKTRRLKFVRASRLRKGVTVFSKFDELLSRFEFSMCWFYILKGIPRAFDLGFRGLGFMVDECFAGFLLNL